MPKEEKKEEKPRWSVYNQPTQEVPMVMDSEEEKLYSHERALCEILNKLEEIQALIK